MPWRQDTNTTKNLQEVYDAIVHQYWLWRAPALGGHRSGGDAPHLEDMAVAASSEVHLLRVQGGLAASELQAPLAPAGHAAAPPMDMSWTPRRQ